MKSAKAARNEVKKLYKVLDMPFPEEKETWLETTVEDLEVAQDLADLEMVEPCDSLILLQLGKLSEGVR
jgi:hypothetical protein